MIGKFLLWLGIYLGLVFLMSYNPYLGFMLVLLSAIATVVIAYIVGTIKTFLLYKRDPWGSTLMGRMTCGIDHKGRPTHRIIWY